MQTKHSNAASAVPVFLMAAPSIGNESIESRRASSRRSTQYVTLAWSERSMVIVGGMLRLLLLLGSHHPRGRALLSVLGIALGVALGYGVYLVNRAAVDELAAAVRGLAGEADLEVRGGRGGFPDSLYPAIARLPGVASASPGLELDAGLAGTERTIRLIGIDALRERRPEIGRAHV